MPDTEPYTLPSVTAAEALDLIRAGAKMVDLRKPHARAASGQTVAGALLRDPLIFDHTDPLCQGAGQVVTFCVHGHEVSQFGCALLLVHGRDAVYVSGGFDALAAAGAPLEELPR